MGKADNKAASIKRKLVKTGGATSLYSFSDATVTYNDEKEITNIEWSTPTTVYTISSDNYSWRRTIEKWGEVSDETDRILLMPYDSGVSDRDKIVILTDAYLVQKIHKIDPIENTVLMYIVELVKDDTYTVD